MRPKRSRVWSAARCTLSAIREVGLQKEVRPGFSFLHVEEGEVGAELAERLRHRAAEVAGAAGDHHGFLIEPHCASRRGTPRSRG